MENNRLDLIAIVSDQVSSDVLLRTLNSISITHGLLHKIHVAEFNQSLSLLNDYRSPKLLILDISSTDLPLSDLELIMQKIEPSTLVIVLGTQNDVILYRSLLMLGVVEYILKPINPDFCFKLLSKMIDENFSPVRYQARLGNVSCFYGIKGGVGSSYLATNVAAALANKLYKRTLLLDCDFIKANCSFLLDANNVDGLKEVFKNESLIDKDIIERFFININEKLILLSTQIDARQELSNGSLSSMHTAYLPKLMDLIRSQFHYMIIDWPNSLIEDLPWSDRILMHLDDLIIVIEPNMLCLRECIKVIESSNNSHKIKIVVNKRGQYTKGELDLNTIAKSLGREVTYSCDFDAISPLVSTHIGEPIINMQDSKLAKHILDLMYIITGQYNPLLEKKSTSSFMLLRQKMMHLLSKLRFKKRDLI